jgi:hypothetical protein
MFIILNSRPDRLGSNLTWYIMQIVYAHYKKYFIHYHNDSPFSSSLFVQAMIDYIEKYNYNLGETLGNHDHLFTESFIEESQQDWPGNNMIVCNEIKSDLLSYFKKHIYPEFSKLLALRATRSDTVYRNVVVIPFNKTIAVHLRLDDVVERRDYNGIFSSQYYREKIESGKINIDLEDERLFFKRKGIDIQGWNREYNEYDCQAPLPEHKVEFYIQMAKKKYPNHQVLLVTSPNSKTTLPYKVIQSPNTDTDLLILSKADVLICSKSLFCFTSVYFSKASEIFLPMWGHVAGTGLTSYYDNNTNITYIY